MRYVGRPIPCPKLCRIAALVWVLAAGCAWAEDASPAAPETFPAGDGRYRIHVDTSKTPELAEWVRGKVVPMATEWYPRLAAMLPSEGFEAPAELTIAFDPEMEGVAATSGTYIRCAADWMGQNREGEAVGAVFHELVHVVQQYGGARPGAEFSRPPWWLTEGIADYLRWFIFEPETHGADLRRRNLDQVRYDGSYRISANFLNWVTAKQGADFVPELNARIRQGRYNESVWKDLTGTTVQDLGAAWKADLEKARKADAGGRDGAAQHVLPTLRKSYLRLT